MRRFRAPPPDALIAVLLDEFTAVFHRPSGTTHLLTAPAPEILAALADAPLSADELLAALASDYTLADADTQALLARIDELVAAGLVTAA
ncbi:HPr-rel-A system PqqD family peptide chaperone [Sphingomonas bacterium]|uniref:HPr-rel-A system PqqD family peptide chaperone n=1 Tax=Sphingomonas bacterium TaxID=1895847 RepID=UPI001576A030|nr:HPr-rel-A system PqqD family peptide chaperone [Sphingomonas bacterium]